MPLLSLLSSLNIIILSEKLSIIFSAVVNDFFASLLPGAALSTFIIWIFPPTAKLITYIHELGHYFCFFISSKLCNLPFDAVIMKARRSRFKLFTSATNSNMENYLKENHKIQYLINALSGIVVVMVIFLCLAILSYKVKLYPLFWSCILISGLEICTFLLSSDCKKAAYILKSWIQS